MAYVIEQWHVEKLQYWDGVEQRAGSLKEANRWTPDYASAVKFADRESATKVLIYICGGVGRVTEHATIGEGQPAH